MVLVVPAFILSLPSFLHPTYLHQVASNNFNRATSVWIDSFTAIYRNSWNAIGERLRMQDKSADVLVEDVMRQQRALLNDGILLVGLKRAIKSSMVLARADSAYSDGNACFLSLTCLLFHHCHSWWCLSADRPKVWQRTITPR